jgi:hypothetical protein
VEGVSTVIVKFSFLIASGEIYGETRRGLQIKKPPEGGQNYQHTKAGLITRPLLVFKTELRPTLLLDEVGHNRNFDILALVGFVGPVQENKPEQRHTNAAKAQGNGRENDTHDEEGNIRRERLNCMELDERSGLLLVHEQDDDGNESNGVTKRSPELVVAGDIRIKFRHNFLLLNMVSSILQQIIQKATVSTPNPHRYTKN